jgi:SEC-C motif/Protein of unknown function (DUF1186)
MNPAVLPAVSPDLWWLDANPEALAWVREHASRKPTWEELRSRLETIPQPPIFPLEAVRCAQAGWPDYAPHFRQVLERCVDAPAVLGDDDNALPMFAGQLLAEHRDPECFVIAQKLMALSIDEMEALLGYEWSETLEPWLAAFCHQKRDGVEWLAACAKDTSFFAGKRHAAIGALAYCCGAGTYTEREFSELCLDVMQDVANHGCVEEPQDFIDASALMGLVLCSLMDVNLSAAAVPQIKQWYEDKRIDDSIVPYSDVLELIKTPIARVPKLPGCTVAEISKWAWFNEEADESSFNEDFNAPGLSYLRPEPKVGRNDPCPCGSGKKFKKCCGA